MGSHTWSATTSCEDHLNTAGATGSNRTPFAALFLRGRIGFRWHQHKRRVEGVAPLSWVDFKTFLQKNLRDSRAFVTTNINTVQNLGVDRPHDVAKINPSKATQPVAGKLQIKLDRGSSH